MKQLAIALLALLGLGLSTAHADDVMCHDVYSHTAGDIVITASNRGGPSGALRLYGSNHIWATDVTSGLFHTRLCAEKVKWSEWNLQHKSAGMSVCITLSGQPDHCKGFSGQMHEELTCASQQYFYYARR